MRGLLKDEIIKKYSVVPIGYENKVLTVAISDPSDIKTIDELQFATGYRIKPVLVFSLDVKRLIQKIFWRGGCARTSIQVKGSRDSREKGF